MTDITDRERSDKLLQRSQEQLSLAIEGSGMDFWEWNVRSGEIEITERWAEAIGYSLPELAPISISTWSRLIYPDDLEKSNQLLKQHFKRRIPVFDCEIRMLHKNGDWVWTKVYGKVMAWDKNGKPVRMSGTHRNITEEKRIDALLQQTQKSEVMGMLAGGIAHDLNNILFPLLGFTEFLKEEVPADSPFQDHINEIFHAALRARELVKQILTFSRKGDQTAKPTQLHLIIKEVLKLLRPWIPATIDIQRQIDAKCGLVMVDPTHVHQIVMNLATNACHAMEDSGGKLMVSLKQIELTPESALSASLELAMGRYALLTVSDTGTGIEKANLHKIFEPYFTTKGVGKSTGLGLSVVLGIIKNYKGDIRIFSEPEKGTEVCVYLPIMEVLNENGNCEDNESCPGGTGRVLLIDDDEVIVRLEKQMLERLGYQVEVRLSGTEAVTAFRADPDAFDLVITDLSMPEMTGVQLAGEFKSIKAGIPVIICTGFNDKIDKKSFNSMGIDGLLIKPVIKTEMAHMVRNVLHKNDSMIDRRQYKRYDAYYQTGIKTKLMFMYELLDGQIADEIQIHREGLSTIFNISKGGCYVHSYAPLPLKTRLLITLIPLAFPSDKIIVTGRIVRKTSYSQDGAFYGIEFIAYRDDGQIKLHKFIEYLAANEVPQAIESGVIR